MGEKKGRFLSKHSKPVKVALLPRKNVCYVRTGHKLLINKLKLINKSDKIPNILLSTPYRFKNIETAFFFFKEQLAILTALVSVSPFCVTEIIQHESSSAVAFFVAPKTAKSFN